MPPVRRVAAVCALALVAFSLWGVLSHARAVSAVRVVLREGAQEPRDPLLGERAQPDYNLRLRSGDDWVDCGTFKDRSAKDGLVFEVQPPIPIFGLVELQLREDDQLRDEVLEQLPLRGDAFEGDDYRFELTDTFELQAGLAWFFDTPVGVLVGLGIVIGTLLSFIKFDL